MTGRSNMNDVKISLIIPTFNREKFLTETIDSCLRQNVPIDEIIIIDNKSEDTTFSTAQKFAQKYPVIQAYQNESNVGMIRNWNIGMKKARYGYVSILHSDDILAKNWTETVKNAIHENQHRNIAVYFGIATKSKIEQGRIQKLSILQPFNSNRILQPQQSIESLWKRFYFNINSSGAIIYDKNIVEKLGYFNPEKNLEADQDLHIRILNNYASYFICQNLVYYRIHPLQAFDQKQKIRSEEDRINVILRSIEIQKENLKNQELIFYYYSYVIVFFLKTVLTFHFKMIKKFFHIKHLFSFKTLRHTPSFIIDEGVARKFLRQNHEPEHT